MPRLPQREEAFLTWTAQHLTLWAGQGIAPTIGMTPEQVAAAQLKLDSAVAARSTAIAARLASVTRTSEKDVIVGELRAVMGGLIGQVDGFARATENEGVYDLASISKPKDPTPRTDAPVPSDLEIRASSFGDLVLTFEASKGQGSVFIIERQLRPIGGEPGAWTSATTSSEKEWTDTSVPNGVASVRYRVRTKLTNGVLSDWSEDKGFFYGTGDNQVAQPQAQTQQSVEGGSEGGGGDGPGGGQSVTIEDAQALKDAQTAKGKGQAG